MPPQRRTLARLRSKLLRLRLLARDCVRRGGDSHALRLRMDQIKHRLDRRQFRAAEHEVDAVIAALRKDHGLRDVDLPAA